jgi:monoamine oxidase
VIDVVVIGAGVSGLACARRLADAGAEVIVLEARDRIGGRILTHRFDGMDPVELGAMFVHGEHASTIGVIGDAGLTLSSGPEGGGEVLVLIDGDVRTGADVFGESDAGSMWSAEQAVAELDAGDVPLRAALASQGWSEQRTRFALELFEEIWCADPDVLSAEGVARVERGWTSGRRNFGIAEGYDRLPAFLAAGLDVRLGLEVSRVRWSTGYLAVEAGDEECEAAAAVVTVPPSVVAEGSIVFDPALPQAKRSSARSIPVGPVMRLAGRLREPAPSGGWILVAEGGWWTVRPGSQLLTGWIGGPPAARASGLSLGRLLERLRPALPWLGADRLDELVVADWGSDPFSRGGYSYPAAGALDAPSSWAAPVDRTLFFAGEATCGDVHPATVHGAYESGLRAADEVIQVLGAAA